MRTAELLTMSTKELERAELLCRIRERRITQEQAAEMLGVSTRQLRRWYQAYKAGGPAALASKKRGRPSNNQLPETSNWRRCGSFGSATRASARRLPTRS